MELKIGDWVEVIADVESMNFEPCKGQFGMIADKPINGIYPIRLEGTSAYLSADEFRQANTACTGRACLVCKNTGIVPKGYMRGQACICQAARQ